MPRRHRARISRSDPACPRCGNEADLAQWLDGVVYCLECLTCPHGAGGTSYVCPTCVRALHTVMTFAGPRVTNVDYYVDEAYREYGVTLDDVRVWTFDEQERLSELHEMRHERPQVKSFGVVAPPPHHRFTSLDGNH